MSNVLPLGCELARRQLSLRLDGLLSEPEASLLEAHLATCADCRLAAQGLSSLVGALGQLPRLALPDADLQEIWARTVDAPRGGRRWRIGLAIGAAAAIAAGALVALERSDGRRESTGDEAEFSSAELHRAQADLLLVAELTERALRTAERRAADTALDKGVTPALRQVPVLRQSIHTPATRNRRN